MLTCPSCSAELPDGARFCSACGARLPGEATREVRKLVTVLFCDLVGSTAIAERSDSEVVREIVAAFFQRATAAIERHGGTVANYAGDAVLALFGTPMAHDDDALRAVRAAIDVRADVAALNRELGVRFDIALDVHAGVATGEVLAGITGMPGSPAMGDVVNLAARLEQAAAPGEILVSESTLRLARGRIAVEQVAPLELKGKREAVRAHRVVSAASPFAAPASRREGTLHGRETELAGLEAAFARCVADRAPQLVTVLGEPGIGKSRLANEFLRGLASRATILRCRCLSYGDGISYWPLAELLRDAAGVADTASASQARASLAALVGDGPDAAQLADTLAAVLRVSTATPSAEQIAWAARRVLTRRATRAPLVVLIDDLQWAEGVFLDLVKGLPGLIAEVPLLVLVLARPELLETRPEWKQLGELVPLEPLTADAVAALLAQLAGGMLPAAVARLVMRASGGNALFAEELLGEMLESGALRRSGDGWELAVRPEALTLPSTLDALLGSRLDRLPVAEQATLERASVEGEVFHLGAVKALARGAADEASRAVMALTERAIVAETDAEVLDERAFRFRHLLIRDAAYRRLPKAARAALHEEFADWLEERAGDRAAEYEEVLAYHVELAHALRVELGRRDDATTRLGERAGVLLTSSGRVALGRGDMAAAATLLRRALALTPATSPLRGLLLVDLAEALNEQGAYPEAAAVQAEIEALDDERLSALAAIGRMQRTFFSHVPMDRTAERRRLEGAYEALAGDELALARVARALAWLDLFESQSERMIANLELALDHARRAGSSREINDTLYLLPMTTVFGPMPRTEAVERCQEWLRLSEPVSKVRALTLLALGCLSMLEGRLDEARTLVADAERMLRDDLGMRALLNTGSGIAIIEAYAGSYGEAERLLRAAYEEAARYATPNPSIVCDLASAVLEQGRIAEALAIVEHDDVAGAVGDDPEAYVRWLGVRAQAHARAGELERAEGLAEAVLDAARQVDAWENTGIALRAAAEVHERAGRRHEARALVEDALRVYERKGDDVFSGRMRRWLDHLDRAGSPDM